MRKEKPMKRNAIDTFKHMIEDSKFCNGDHGTAQVDQKENGKKIATVLIAMLIMMVKVITFHLSYVLKTKGQISEANQEDKLTQVSLMHQIDEAQEAG